MCDPALRDNPPAPDDGHVRTRPFDFQRHLHNQSQPEIAAFLARLRAVCDSYGERFTVAEVGGAEAPREMVRFTAPGRLDSTYGFNFLYPNNPTPALLRLATADRPDQHARAGRRR